MNQPWDMLRAELYDTIRDQDQHPRKRPCVYCSALTRSRYQVCMAHDDLIDLDPGYPSALDETVETSPQGSPVSSSAEAAGPHATAPGAVSRGQAARTNGSQVGRPEVAALDIQVRA